MTLDDKQSKALLDELAARNDRIRSERLAAAKAEAAERGKEPFDLGKLEALVDTSHEGRLAPEDARRRKYEEMYYVEHPELMTLAELAAVVAEINQWS
jgi:hypothetical protein